MKDSVSISNEFLTIVYEDGTIVKGHVPNISLVSDGRWIDRMVLVTEVKEEDAIQRRGDT